MEATIPELGPVRFWSPKSSSFSGSDSIVVEEAAKNGSRKVDGPNTQKIRRAKIKLYRDTPYLKSETTKQKKLRNKRRLNKLRTKEDKFSGNSLKKTYGIESVQMLLNDGQQGCSISAWHHLHETKCWTVGDIYHPKNPNISPRRMSSYFSCKEDNYTSALLIQPYLDLGTKE